MSDRKAIHFISHFDNLYIDKRGKRRKIWPFDRILFCSLGSIIILAVLYFLPLGMLGVLNEASGIYGIIFLFIIPLGPLGIYAIQKKEKKKCVKVISLRSTPGGRFLKRFDIVILILFAIFVTYFIYIAIHLLFPGSTLYLIKLGVIFLCIIIVLSSGIASSKKRSPHTVLLLCKELGFSGSNKLVRIEPDRLILGKVSKKVFSWESVQEVYRTGSQVYFLRMHDSEEIACFIDYRIIGTFLRILKENNLDVHKKSGGSNKVYRFSNIRNIFDTLWIAIYLSMFFLIAENVGRIVGKTYYSTFTYYYLGVNVYSIEVYYYFMAAFYILFAVFLVFPAAWNIFKTYEVYGGLVVIKLFGRVVKVKELAPEKPAHYYKYFLDKQLAELYWFHTLDERYKIDSKTDIKLSPLNIFAEIYLGFRLWALFLFSLAGMNNAERKLCSLKAEGRLE